MDRIRNSDDLWRELDPYFDSDRLYRSRPLTLPTAFDQEARGVPQLGGKKKGEKKIKEGEIEEEEVISVSDDEFYHYNALPEHSTPPVYPTTAATTSSQAVVNQGVVQANIETMQTTTLTEDIVMTETKEEAASAPPSIPASIPTVNSSASSPSPSSLHPLLSSSVSLPISLRSRTTPIPLRRIRQDPVRVSVGFIVVVKSLLDSKGKTKIKQNKTIETIEIKENKKENKIEEEKNAPSDSINQSHTFSSTLCHPPSSEHKSQLDDTSSSSLPHDFSPSDPITSTHTPLFLDFFFQRLQRCVTHPHEFTLDSSSLSIVASYVKLIQESIVLQKDHPPPPAELNSFISEAHKLFYITHSTVRQETEEKEERKGKEEKISTIQGMENKFIHHQSSSQTISSMPSSRSESPSLPITSPLTVRSTFPSSKTCSASPHMSTTPNRIQIDLTNSDGLLPPIAAPPLTYFVLRATDLHYAKQTASLTPGIDPMQPSPPYLLSNKAIVRYQQRVQKQQDEQVEVSDVDGAATAPSNRMQRLYATEGFTQERGPFAEHYTFPFLLDTATLKIDEVSNLDAYLQIPPNQLSTAALIISKQEIQECDPCSTADVSGDSNSNYAFIDPDEVSSSLFLARRELLHQVYANNFMRKKLRDVMQSSGYFTPEQQTARKEKQQEDAKTMALYRQHYPSSYSAVEEREQTRANHVQLTAQRAGKSVITADCQQIKKRIPRTKEEKLKRQRDLYHLNKHLKGSQSGAKRGRKKSKKKDSDDDTSDSDSESSGSGDDQKSASGSANSNSSSDSNSDSTDWSTSDSDSSPSKPKAPGKKPRHRMMNVGGKAPRSSAKPAGDPQSNIIVIPRPPPRKLSKAAERKNMEAIQQVMRELVYTVENAERNRELAETQHERIRQLRERRDKRVKDLADFDEMRRYINPCKSVLSAIVSQIELDVQMESDEAATAMEIELPEGETSKPVNSSESASSSSFPSTSLSSASCASLLRRLPFPRFYIEPIYCKERRPFNINRPMVRCDHCAEFWHSTCMLKENANGVRIRNTTQNKTNNTRSK